MQTDSRFFIKEGGSSKLLKFFCSVNYGSHGADVVFPTTSESAMGLFEQCE